MNSVQLSFVIACTVTVDTLARYEYMRHIVGEKLNDFYCNLHNEVIISSVY